MSSSSTPAIDQFQRCVVDFPSERSLLVCACAGSGKSTTLALRVKSLLDAGMPASRVLVLTFSTKSRADLLSKIERAVPPPAELPAVNTYHARALACLRQAGCTSTVMEPRVARKEMKAVLLDLGLLNESPGDGRQQSRSAVRAALAVVAKAKAGSGGALSAEERDILRAYNCALAAKGLIDFDDMVPMATEAIDAGACAMPNGNYLHVLLDEAQDTSGSQLAFLQRLAPRSSTVVTCVGDADQSIYGFRGSQPDMLTRLTAAFGCMPLILPTNYRCASSILNLAKSLIEGSPLREHLPLLSAPRAAAGEVMVIQKVDRQAEIEAICREVLATQERSEGGREATHSIALLCRLRVDCLALRRALKEYGVACVQAEKGEDGGGGVGGDGGGSTAATVSLAWLRLVVEPKDDLSFLACVAAPSRAGFGGGEASPGIRYLRSLAASKSNGQRSVCLLVAAIHAARKGWPPAGPSRLSRPQQEALSSFLQDYEVGGAVGSCPTRPSSRHPPLCVLAGAAGGGPRRRRAADRRPPRGARAADRPRGDAREGTSHPRVAARRLHGGVVDVAPRRGGARRLRRVERRRRERRVKHAPRRQSAALAFPPHRRAGRQRRLCARARGRRGPRRARPRASQEIHR